MTESTDRGQWCFAPTLKHPSIFLASVRRTYIPRRSAGVDGGPPLGFVPRIWRKGSVGGMAKRAEVGGGLSKRGGPRSAT